MNEGAWTPTTRENTEIIEDYLMVSRKRKGNKLAMQKLQMHILTDLIAHQHMLDAFQKELAKCKSQDSSDEKTIKHIEREIFSNELIIKNLKDIVDGIACRLFKHNRALLYYLGDNPDIGPTRPSVGLVNEIKVWGDEFAYSQKTAILNALTNFIRIGDITVFLDDGSVEFVEVKSSGSPRGQQRKARLERQGNRLDETIKFFNTGVTTLDERTIHIKNMPLMPKYRFDLLEKVINEAMISGVSDVVIEDYLIIQCADFRCKKSVKEIINHLEKNSEVIRDSWQANKDIVTGKRFLSHKLDFSKNFVPISVWPLSEDICANLMMGGLTICFSANISELLRKFKAAGWEKVYSIYDLSEEEFKLLNSENVQKYITLKKGEFYIEVPPALIGRCTYEFLSPDTLIESFEWSYKNTPKYQQGQYILPNFEKENEVWN